MKRILSIVLTALASQCVLFGQLPGSAPRFYGYLRYDAETFTQSGGPVGLYNIDATAEGRVKPVDLNLKAAGGGCYGEGTYYVVDYTQNNYGELTSVKLKTYNPEGWVLVSEKDIPQTSIPTTMTYNHAEHKIYGCFFNNETDKMEFATMNEADGSTSVIKVLDVSIAALACSHDGIIYAVDDNGDLSRFDSAAGDFVKIGATGLKPKYIQDATFDYDTKTMYWFAMTESPDQAGIYVVDTEIGTASRVTKYTSGEKEFTGVFSMAPVCVAEAPGMVSNVSVSVNPATMKADVECDMPVETYGGQPLAGAIGYEVCVNDVKQTEGEAGPGEKINVTIDVAAGECRISIRTLNAAGNGPSYYHIAYAGFDIPDKVPNVVAMRSAAGIKVTWDQVTTGVTGNPIDLSNLNYTVTRMPDGVVVGELITALELTDGPVETDATKCHYEVVAHTGDKASEAGISNDVVYGAAVALPMAYDFRNKPGLGLFAVEDANADGVSWQFRDKYGILVGSGRTQLDDWLITPPIKLTSGRKYKLIASIGASMGNEKFEVKYGETNRPENMTGTIIEPTEIDDIDYWYRDVWDEPGNFEAFITPEETGEYHIGVHGISEPGGLFLYCCDLSLEDAGASGVEDGMIDVDAGMMSVTSSEGCIVVAGASGSVSVFSVSGQKVAESAGDARFSVSSGVYVVKSGTDVRKVLVK